MGNDIVELADAIVQHGDIRHPQFDVVEPEGVHQALTSGNLRGGQIDTDEARPRQPAGHRDQVSARGTAQLQHAAAIRLRRVQTHQPSERGQMVGMRAGQAQALVEQSVVIVHWGSVAQRRHAAAAVIVV